MYLYSIDIPASSARVGVEVVKMLASYHIDKAIPLPPKIGRQSKMYPFPYMEVGDSFKTTADEYEKASRAAYAYAHAHHCQFACRKTDEGGRIWRIA